MHRTILQTGTTILVILPTLGMLACGGSKVLKYPEPLVHVHPLTANADSIVTAQLDWVIVRDGPGTWAKNADWDEYLLTVQNLADEPIRITEIAVYDSLDTRLTGSANRKKLVKASRETARRYKDSDIRVKAGVGGTALLAAGGASYVAANAMAAAVLSGSAGAGTAGAAIGAVALAPVLMVGGVVRSVRNDRVSQEIVKRHTALPADVASREQQSLVVFFPLSPSPKRVELVYEHSGAVQRLSIDTREILQGLHIDNGKP